MKIGNRRFNPLVAYFALRREVDLASSRAMAANIGAREGRERLALAGHLAEMSGLLEQLAQHEINHGNADGDIVILETDIERVSRPFRFELARIPAGVGKEVISAFVAALVEIEHRTAAKESSST